MMAKLEESTRLAGSRGLPQHGQHSTRRAGAGVALRLRWAQLLPHLGKSCEHGAASIALRQDRFQLRANSLRCEAALHQLRHCVSLGNQVRHGKTVNLHKTSPKGPRERSDLV